MSEIKAELLIISGSKLATKFMQCADVFEKSKVIGTLSSVVVSYNEGEKLDFKKASKLVDATRDAYTKLDMIVSFIHLKSITDGQKTILNKGEVTPYFNKEVRVISDGQSWFLLCDFIKHQTGLQVNTDENMFITSIGIPLSGLSPISTKFPKK